MSIYELGDEGLGRQYGPHRFALWFDEELDYRRNNERFWRVRRKLIQSDIWGGFAIDSVPLIPEWFGILMPHEHAYRESGYPWIWCEMLGFPTPAMRTEALKLIISDSPSGLVKWESEPPDPHEYTLPLVGFVAKNAYLTLEAGHPRGYDSWRGYETLALADEDEAGLLEVMEVPAAERMLLRRLALNVGRRFDVPLDGGDLGSLVDHARELWAMGTVAAAGGVAGTAMEKMLTDQLTPTDLPPPSKRTLGPLINRVVEKHEIDEEQADLLHSFRKLRNTCAHALADEAGVSLTHLEQAVDEWLKWMESWDPEESDGGALPEVVVMPHRPDPAKLHEMADAAGQLAAKSCTPKPMHLSGSGGEEVVSEGVCGNAEVLVSPASDPFAKWLISEGHASKEGERAAMWIGFRTVGTQSMERAVAYARSYIDTLRSYGVSADYQTHID